MTLSKVDKKSKKGLVAFLIVIGVLIVAIIAFSISGASNRAAYKTQFTQVQGIDISFQTIYDQYENAPSATTRTKAEWDTYYTGLSTQIQTLNTTLSIITYTDSRLVSVQNSLKKALDDFSSYLTLSQSNIDMQFQITSDQSIISSDKSISAEEADFGRGYVTANKNKLDADTTTLTNDQNTYNQQGEELKTLATNLANADASLKVAVKTAQPSN